MSKLGGKVVGTAPSRRCFKVAKDGKEVWVDLTREFTGKYFLTIVERAAMTQDLESNLKFSQGRADAVVQARVGKHGIAAALPDALVPLVVLDDDGAARAGLGGLDQEFEARSLGVEHDRLVLAVEREDRGRDLHALGVATACAVADADLHGEPGTSCRARGRGNPGSRTQL